jgi:hypothetical protein
MSKFMDLKIKKNIRYQKNDNDRMRRGCYRYSQYQILSFSPINKTYLYTNLFKIHEENIP